MRATMHANARKALLYSGVGQETSPPDDLAVTGKTR